MCLPLIKGAHMGAPLRAMTKTRQELEAEGWEKRFVAEEPRLSESVELYESMGYEVYLLPLDEAAAEECNICFEGHRSKYKIIYTKRKV